MAVGEAGQIVARFFIFVGENLPAAMTSKGEWRDGSNSCVSTASGMTYRYE